MSIQLPSLYVCLSLELQLSVRHPWGVVAVVATCNHIDYIIIRRCVVAVSLLLFVADQKLSSAIIAGQKLSSDSLNGIGRERSIRACRKMDVRATSNCTLSTVVPSLVYCAKQCVANPTCSSFNWKRSARICELVFQCLAAPIYRADTDYVHYSPDACPVSSNV